MSNKPNDPNVQLTKEDIKDLLGAVLEEARKPPVDQTAEERKKRAREHNKQLMREMEANERARQAACNHRRYDNTSTIFWMAYSDDIVRGVCCRCQKKFEPGDPQYDQMIRVPTYRADVII